MSNINLASGYYLKALDNFHFAADEALEQLNYALSYDEEHAPSHCLMGALYMQYLKDYTEAMHCFELALLYDVNYVDTYKWYINLCLWIGDLSKADQLISRASKISAFSKASIYQYKMMLAENKSDIRRALVMTDFGTTSRLKLSVLKQSCPRVLVRVKRRKNRNKTTTQYDCVVSDQI